MGNGNSGPAKKPKRLARLEYLDILEAASIALLLEAYEAWRLAAEERQIVDTELVADGSAFYYAIRYTLE